MQFFLIKIDMYIYVKPPLGDLNLAFVPYTLQEFYTYGVTNTAKVRGSMQFNFHLS